MDPITKLFEEQQKSKVMYHGGPEEVRIPKIVVTRFTKDFGPGFYVTKFEDQAKSWATRSGSRMGVVSKYRCSSFDSLRYKSFRVVSDKWLDFIIACRSGVKHDYDIVEGPMADDTIYSAVNDFLNGFMPRSTILDLAKFRYPTHQIVLCTEEAIKRLNFVSSTRC